MPYVLAFLALAFVCSNHEQVKSPEPLNIGIRFHLENPLLVQQAKLALDYYKTIIDMVWYEDDSQACVLNLVDERLADDINAVARRTGTIAFNTKFSFTPREQFVISIHEFGHEFGIPHSDSNRSAMFESAEEMWGFGLLDRDDLQILFSKHKQR